MEFIIIIGLAFVAVLGSAIVPVAILGTVRESYKEIKASNARVASAVNQMSDLRLRELERRMGEIEEKLDQLLAEKEQK